MTTTNLKLLNAVAQSIYDKKGFNILALDVRGISTLTDYVVIAEGNIDRHVKAISSTLRHTLQDIGSRPAYVEGESTGDWVVIDCGEVTIHLMQTDVREKYALEELWRTAKIVDVKIDTKKPTKD